MPDVLLMGPLKAKLKILSVLCCQKGGTLMEIMAWLATSNHTMTSRLQALLMQVAPWKIMPMQKIHYFSKIHIGRWTDEHNRLQELVSHLDTSETKSYC